jgi:hypothetical protein
LNGAIYQLDWTNIQLSFLGERTHEIAMRATRAFAVQSWISSSSLTGFTLTAARLTHDGDNQGFLPDCE